MGILNLLRDPFLFFSFIVAIIIAISIHEASHAWSAYKLGDPTAKYLGRITLNPLAHLDPIGTILLLLAGFGWGKPVPVNPHNLRGDARVGMTLVSVAGPLSNVATAALFYLPIRFGLVDGFGHLEYLLTYIVYLNIVLAVFNMIPLPPLDGFKVLLGILPRQMAYSFSRIEQYGMPILFVLLFSGQLLQINILGTLMDPVIGLIYNVITL